MVIKKKNKIKLINYLKLYGGYTGKIWLDKNKKVLFSKKDDEVKELYIPRTIFNFWMEERLISLISEMKRISKKYLIKFNISFFKGEVVEIKRDIDDYKKIIFKNNLCEQLNYKINNNKFKKINFTKHKIINEVILSKTQNIGLGLPPPKQLATKKAQQSNFYMWDFYSEGSTSNLIKKILSLKKKNKIKMYFIGYKAGLLESLPELKETIINKKIKIEILCSSKDLEGIQKAQLSFNKKIYKFIFLKKNNLKKIKKAKQLYLAILNEFKLSISAGYNKYDSWTHILNNNILHKCINNFNNYEKLQYNNIYHRKIRNLTRFTYPETILAREKLSKMKILKSKREQVIKVDVFKKMLKVSAIGDNKKRKKYICDLIINVSGPLNAKNIKNEIPLVRSLKMKGAKTTNVGGFAVDKNFSIIGIKNVYSPGILSRGFNPERKTIIKAILENSKKCGQGIAKTLIGI